MRKVPGRKKTPSAVYLPHAHAINTCEVTVLQEQLIERDMDDSMARYTGVSTACT